MPGPPPGRAAATAQPPLRALPLARRCGPNYPRRKIAREDPRCPASIRSSGRADSTVPTLRLNHALNRDFFSAWVGARFPPPAISEVSSPPLLVEQPRRLLLARSAVESPLGRTGGFDHFFARSLAHLWRAASRSASSGARPFAISHNPNSSTVRASSKRSGVGGNTFPG